MDNLYTISQFSKKVNVSTSTLRRWDKLGEFKAKKHKRPLVAGFMGLEVIRKS